jgi:hypothetical protein
MKRLLGLACALTLVVGVAAGCGDKSDSSSGATTTAASGTSDSGEMNENSEGSSESAGGTSDTGNAAVDKYCNDIAALADEIAQVKADPTKGDLQALGQKSQDIAGQATALAGEVMKDPSLGSKIQECTKQLDAANS